MKMMRYIDPIIFLNFLAKEDRTYRGTVQKRVVPRHPYDVMIRKKIEKEDRTYPWYILTIRRYDTTGGMRLVRAT